LTTIELGGTAEGCSEVTLLFAAEAAKEEDEAEAGTPVDDEAVVETLKEEDVEDDCNRRERKAGEPSCERGI